MSEEKRTGFAVSDKMVRLMAAASKDSIRSKLRGVYFDWARKLAVATTGEFLAVKNARDEESPPWGEIIAFGKLKKAPREGTPRHFQSSGWKTYDEATGAGTAEKVEERFPQYEQVIPRERPNEFIVGLSAKLLKQLADAIDTSRAQNLTLSFDPEHPGAPILVIGDEGCGVLMPTRLDGGEPDSPLKRLHRLMGWEGV